MLRAVVWTALLTAALCLPLGVWLGWLIFRPAPAAPTAETFKTATVQSDGSVQLMRLPNADPPPAPHQIPAGAREERRLSVVIQPDPPPPQEPFSPDADGLCRVAPPECPPLQLDLSLVRDKEGRRVIASSPDGRVLAEHSVDMPILNPDDAPRPHAFTLTGNPGRDVVAFSYGRELPDFRPFGLATAATVGAVYTGGHLVPVAGVTFRFR